MSLYTRVCISLFGIAAGIVILFAAVVVILLFIDMTLNSGQFAAHAIHSDHPGCSGSCHGPHPEIPAQGLALPPVRDSDRSHATPAQSRRGALLGVRMATQGGD
jgi:hypothetical protein